MAVNHPDLVTFSTFVCCPYAAGAAALSWATGTADALAWAAIG